jgi:hypothetical protein
MKSLNFTRLKGNKISIWVRRREGNKISIWVRRRGGVVGPEIILR